MERNRFVVTMFDIYWTFTVLHNKLYTQSYGLYNNGWIKQFNITYIFVSCRPLRLCEKCMFTFRFD